MVHEVVLAQKPLVFEGISLLKSPSIETTDFKVHSLGKSSAYVFVDGLSSGIANFLELIFRDNGQSLDYFGGGAGSLSFEKAPCLFTHEGFCEDAAIVALSKETFSLGVSHGWKRISEPMIATKTQKNIVQEINWEPAFQVYKKIVEEHSGLSFSDDNFFDIAKAYPLGLAKDGLDDIVRDPLMLNDSGDLVCVGEVPENAVVSVLNGNVDGLVRAAAQLCV